MKIAEESTISEEQSAKVEEVASQVKSQFISLKEDIVSPVLTHQLRSNPV